MDAPPPIVLGLEGLIKHSLPRIIKIRNTAAGRLAPFLKRLQVSVLLLGTIYRKLSRYDMVPGSDMCIGICHDSLVQTQGMIEAVLRSDDDDNAYRVGAEVLVERLPDEINSFVSSVELLRSTYHEAQAEYILESMRELTNLRRDYSKHLQECAQVREKELKPAARDASSDEQTSASDHGTSLTEPEPPSPKSPRQKAMKENVALAGEELSPPAPAKLEQSSLSNVEILSRAEEIPSCAIIILGQTKGSSVASTLAHGRAIVDARNDNWVSSGMLKRARLDEKIVNIDQNPEPGEPPTFNGSILRRQGTVQLTWSLEVQGEQSAAQTALFSVSDNLPVDVILNKGHVQEGKGVH